MVQEVRFRRSGACLFDHRHGGLDLRTQLFQQRDLLAQLAGLFAFLLRHDRLNLAATDAERLLDLQGIQALAFGAFVRRRV